MESSFKYSSVERTLLCPSVNVGSLCLAFWQAIGDEMKCMTCDVGGCLSNVAARHPPCRLCLKTCCKLLEHFLLLPFRLMLIIIERVGSTGAMDVGY
jgi:hypothetical protein